MAAVLEQVLTGGVGEEIGIDGGVSTAMKHPEKGFLAEQAAAEKGLSTEKQLSADSADTAEFVNVVRRLEDSIESSVRGGSENNGLSNVESDRQQL